MISKPPSPPGKLALRLLPWVLMFMLAAGGTWVRTEAMKKQAGLHYDGILYSALGERLRRDPLDYDPRRILPHLKKVFPNDPVPSYLDRPIFKHPPAFPMIVSFFEPDIRASASAAFAAGAVLLAVLPLGALAAVPAAAAWTGAAALAITAADPAHWTLSAQGLMSTTLALFTFLGLTFFVLGQRRPVFFAASGAFCGLAVMTHYSGALALGGIFLYVLLCDRRRTAEAAFWTVPALTAAAALPWLAMNRAAYGPDFLFRMAEVHGSGFNRGLIAWTVGGTAALASVLAVTAAYQRRVLRSPDRIGLRSLTMVGRLASWLPAASAALIFGALLLQGGLIIAAAKGFGWADLPDRYATGKNIRTAPWGFYFLRLLELSPFYAASFGGLIVCLWKRTLAPALVPFAVTALLILGWFTLYSEFETRYILPAAPFLAVIAGWVFVEGWRRFRWPVAAAFVYCLLKTLQSGSWLAAGQTVFF